MARGWSYCHDVDTGLGLRWDHAGEPLESSHLHGLGVCVQRFCVLVTDRHPGGYVGTRTAGFAMLAWELKFALQGWFGCLQESLGPTVCAPVSASKKKSLPNATRLATLHAVSDRRNVRESFRAEIVVQFPRNALHHETVCALWIAGRALMRWQCRAPPKGRG